ncbi:hypothetical protein [Streptomyces sp. SID8352]|uniref:hypothetical protein n=1 Tax=Streptomyces sp. SID8352 TaxID=2690338 RepID=UPI00136C701F|nr:hypothetical protein [Streptomyces sp. SID8352]MYU20804.1 hypothetical protein [Streptomyces sp. SID8352]
MAKVWKPGDERRFCRDIKLGKPYYRIHNIDTRRAPWEDPQLYSEIVFTDYLPLTATPCTKYGTAASTVLRQHGPIYDTPPHGMRNLAEAARSVGAPLGDNYEGVLDEDEIRGLEKLVAQSSNPRTRRPIR